MSNLPKMLKVLQLLVDHDALVPTAQRIEFKPTKSGHVRLYLPITATAKEPLMSDLEALVKELDVDVNPFVKAGQITAVTFADFDEAKG